MFHVFRFSASASQRTRRNAPGIVLAVAAIIGAPFLAQTDKIFIYLQKMNGMYFIPDRYLEYLRGQVEELCTGYGPLAVWWWDINRLGPLAPDLNDHIRQLQPGIQINSRGFDPGDFGNPEREHSIAQSREDKRRPVEACNSVGWGSWGWRKHEVFYSPRSLISQHASIWARGGNFLLNIGPRGDGSLPEKSCSLVKQIAEWRGKVREAFQDVQYFETELWGLAAACS